MKILLGMMSVSFVAFLRLVAVLMLIWVQTGQLRTTPPSGPQIAVMAQVDVSDYGNALSFVLSDPIIGLYTDNASAPLGAHAGLRRFYNFGLFSHCAYVDETAGLCAGADSLYLFRPYKVITTDMLSNYSDHTDTIIGNTTFANSVLLGVGSHVARRFLMEGSVVAVVALITGILECVFKWTWASFPNFIAAVAGMSILVGSAIWTALIRTAGRINSWTITTKNVSLGIRVYAGAGLYCTWAAFVLLLASTIPYIINKMGWSFSKDGSLYTLQVQVNPSRELRRNRWREGGRIPLATQLERA